MWPQARRKVEVAVGLEADKEKPRIDESARRPTTRRASTPGRAAATLSSSSASKSWTRSSRATCSTPPSFDWT